MESQRTVLIVDDRPDNLSVFLDILGRAGFRVLVAEDGEAALEQAPLIAPDVIFLDVMMPGIDGFETCRRLKRIDVVRDVPIILVTALSDTADRLRGFAAGGVDYVTKPFRSEEILARAVVHADLTRARRRMQQVHDLLRESAEEHPLDRRIQSAIELVRDA